MKLHLIYARASNGVIGAHGALPWHLPEDMAHFKRLTMGCPVIMGRTTWDSLPARFRPLPGRRNLVLTRQPAWSAAGAEVAHSLAQALQCCQPGADAWVIGGAQVYAEALPWAHSAEVTEIDAAFEGDAFAPVLGPQWRETTRLPQRSVSGLAFSFVSYHNTHPQGN
ncbi:MAG: dihydrofolate reductase [Rhodoferax sp.]